MPSASMRRNRAPECVRCSRTISHSPSAGWSLTCSATRAPPAPRRPTRRPDSSRTEHGIVRSGAGAACVWRPRRRHLGRCVGAARRPRCGLRRCGGPRGCRGPTPGPPELPGPWSTSLVSGWCSLDCARTRTHSCQRSAGQSRRVPPRGRRAAGSCPDRAPPAPEPRLERCRCSRIRAGMADRENTRLAVRAGRQERPRSRAVDFCVRAAARVPHYLANCPMKIELTLSIPKSANFPLPLVSTADLPVQFDPDQILIG